VTPSGKSVFYYSLSTLAMGFGVLFVPNLLLPFFGFQSTTEGWIRVLGLFTLGVGLIYLCCGLTNQPGFIRVPVIERMVFFAGSIGIVEFYDFNPMLAAIGSVDMIGSIWTWFALRQEE
jgi:hypothetical protein